MFACVTQLLWLVFTLIWNAENSLVWRKEFPKPPTSALEMTILYTQ